MAHTTLPNRADSARTLSAPAIFQPADPATAAPANDQHRLEDRSPILLALDLGTRTGWALRDSDGAIISGTEEFRQDRWQGGGMRFLRFKRWLSNTSTTVGKIGAVFFEEVRAHAGVDAAHVYGGMLAILTAWCEHQGVPYQGVPVGTIKRFATGKGNASKDAVIAAMRAKGHAPADDNEADALAILHWALAQGGGR